MLEPLRQQVCRANLELQRQGLVIYSFGNVSGIDRDAGVVVIKASGVPYEQMTPETMVPVALADGRVLQGDLRPSSDTATHLELYRAFAGLGGVCHTHSTYASMWAQAHRPIPCFGTTHADYYHGEVPVTESLTEDEVRSDYEGNTGKVIVRRYAGLDPLAFPAVLVAGHGPFTWGTSPAQAVEHAKVLEQVAQVALGTLQLRPEQGPLPDYLLDKHYLRKHGKNAYYGQR